MNKKILTVLCVSVALNFAFIGFITARHTFMPPCPNVPEKRLDMRRSHFHQEMQKRKSPLAISMKNLFKTHKNEIRQSQENVQKALAADPFDIGAFKQALTDAAELRRTIDDAVQTNMIKIVSEMNGEERKKFAAFLNEHKDAIKPRHEKDKRMPTRKERRFEKHHDKMPPFGHYRDFDEQLPPPPFEEKDGRTTSEIKE